MGGNQRALGDERTTGYDRVFESQRQAMSRAVIALVLLLISGCAETPADTATPDNQFNEISRRQEQAREPVATLSIDTLLAEYQENEFTAAAKYENVEPLLTSCLVGVRLDECRFIETAGTVRDMGRDGNGVAYIRLATSDKFASIEARFDNPEHEALQTLRRGEDVSVRCMVLYGTKHKTSAGLQLTRCVVVPRRIAPVAGRRVLTPE